MSHTRNLVEQSCLLSTSLQGTEMNKEPRYDPSPTLNQEGGKPHCTYLSLCSQGQEHKPRDRSFYWSFWGWEEVEKQEILQEFAEIVSF